jgi:hypothetical protein
MHQCISNPMKYLNNKISKKKFYQIKIQNQFSFLLKSFHWRTILSNHGNQSIVKKLAIHRKISNSGCLKYYDY